MESECIDAGSKGAGLQALIPSHIEGIALIKEGLLNRQTDSLRCEDRQKFKNENI